MADQRLTYFTNRKWDPYLYDKSSGCQFVIAERTLSKIDFFSDMSILDVGCGSGTITAMLASKIEQGSVLGVDTSIEMVQYATQKYHRESNLSFLHLDIQNTSLKKEYDLIVCFNVLHWVYNFESMLKALCALTKPDGRVVIIRPLPNIKVSTAYFKTNAKSRWISYFLETTSNMIARVGTLETFLEAVTASGFEIESYRINEDKYQFKSYDEVTNNFIASRPYPPDMDEKIRAEYLTEVAMQYLDEKNIAHEPPLEHDYASIELMLTKK